MRWQSWLAGAGEVIMGWEEGVEGMCEGEVRELVVPPGLAYGEEGAGEGLIPPGATLHFLLQVRGGGGAGGSVCLGG